MKQQGILQILSSLISLYPLNDQERSQLNARVAEAEKRTGAQLVLSVVERCDDYPELPWKAFALGVGLASLIWLAVDMLNPFWISGMAVLFLVVIILAAGALCALLCVLVPGFARFFLDKERSELEVLQYAESTFLSRELFTTSGRTGILLLIGLFERQVVIRPDTGLEDRLNPSDLHKIIDAMTGPLSSGRIAEALEAGLSGLESALTDTRPLKAGQNELPNDLIEEKGP